MVKGFESWKRIAVIMTLLGALSTAYGTNENNVQESIDASRDFFKRGMSAYKNGKIDQALLSLGYAADMGNIGANWKLGCIYANGDGVPEDDYKAYNFFAHVVEKGADLGSEDESYVSDALVKLACYIKKGIPQTPVKPDPSHAALLYTRAAVSYGNPKAQYYLGKMFLNGEGREKNTVLAARWFQLSARKGNPLAQAMLGNMLLQEGKTVLGAAMLTAAYEKAKEKDRKWIRPLQERAFAICNEFEKRTAISLVDNIIKNNNF